MNPSSDVIHALSKVINDYRQKRKSASRVDAKSTLEELIGLLEQPSGPLSNFQSVIETHVVDSDSSNSESSDDSAQNVNTERVASDLTAHTLDLPTGNSAAQSLAIAESEQPTLDLPSELGSNSNGSAEPTHVTLALDNDTNQNSSRRAGSVRSDSSSSVPPAGKSKENLIGAIQHEIIQAHAAGGLGQVFLAKDVELNRAVALKEIKANKASNTDAKRRFLVEAQITARLAHPNIVPVYAIGAHDDGRPYYTMRFVEGRTLFEAIRKLHQNREKTDQHRWNVQLKNVIRRFLAACYAIEYAHASGYLHRDIKPQNLMLGSHGETIVVDWGLATCIQPASTNRRSDSEAAQTEFFLPPIADDQLDNRPVGTPAYMSPEQLLGKASHIDERSDIFSLGCTLYELGTGEIAFGGTSLQEVTDKVLSGDYREPRTINPSLSPPLAAICKKAIARKKSDRYQTVTEFIEDIELWLNDESPRAYREPLPARVGRWLRRHRRVAIASLTGLVCSLVIATVALVAVNAAKQRTENALAKETAAKRQTLAALNSITDDVIGETFARKIELTESDRKFFHRVIQQYETLSNQYDDSNEARSMQAAGLVRVGNLRRQLSLIDDATKDLNEAIALLREFHRDSPTDADTTETLAHAYYDLGLLHSSQSEFQEAITAYRNAGELFASLSLEQPKETRWSLQQASALNNLANMLWQSGEHDEAKATYQKALEIVPVSMASVDSSVAQKRITTLNNYAGSIKADPEMLTEAIGLYEEAVSLMDRSSSETLLLSESMANARTRTNLATVLTKVGKLDAAIQQLETAISTQQPIVDAYPGYASYRKQFADTQLKLGILKSAKRLPDASDQVGSAIRSLEELAKRFPEQASFKDALANAFELQAKQQFGLSADQAKEKIRAALNIREELAATQNDFQYLRGLLATRIRYANQLRLAEAWTEAIRQYSEIQDSLSDPKVQQLGLSDGLVLNKTLFGLAECYGKIGQYDIALENWARLLDFDGDPYRIVYQLQRTLCLARLGQLNEVEEAVETLKIENPDGLEPVHYYDLACVYSVCASVADEQTATNFLELAKSNFVRSAEMGFFDSPEMQALAIQDDDLAALRSFFDLADFLNKN